MGLLLPRAAAAWLSTAVHEAAHAVALRAVGARLLAVGTGTAPPRTRSDDVGQLLYQLTGAVRGVSVLVGLAVAVKTGMAVAVLWPNGAPAVGLVGAQLLERHHPLASGRPSPGGRAASLGVLAAVLDAWVPRLVGSDRDSHRGVECPARARRPKRRLDGDAVFLALALSLAPAFAEPRDHDRADADRTEQRSERSDRGERGDRAERSDRGERGDRAERADRGERGDRAERADRGERGDRADRASDRGRAERATHAHRATHAAHGDRHAPARRHRPARRHIPAHRHGPPPPPPPRVHHHAHVEVVEAEAPAPRPRAPDNDVSILVNLVDVPVPLLSGGVEFALGRKLGLAGTVGVGFSDTGALYDAGADLRGYLLGDFDRGLFVGGGLGVTNLTPVSVGVDATTFDGFVGGKYTFRGGLTFEAALGAEAYATEAIGVLSPTAKVGVGWSF